MKYITDFTQPFKSPIICITEYSQESYIDADVFLKKSY